MFEHIFVIVAKALNICRICININFQVCLNQKKRLISFLLIMSLPFRSQHASSSSSDPMKSLEEFESYGFWTPKGGVGKSTLCYLISSLYAKINRDINVVIIDCCPQANITEAFLSSPDKDRSVLDKIIKSQVEVGSVCAPSVAGYLFMKLHRQPESPVEKFLTRVNDYNPNLPNNIYLLCGDHRLEYTDSHLSTHFGGPITAFLDPWLEGHSFLHNFQMGTAKYFADSNGRRTVFFVDTNPAFTPYTEVALCAIKRLIIPVNLDEFSIHAVESIFRHLYGVYDDPSDKMQPFLASRFAIQGPKEFRMEKFFELRPRIYSVISNRHANMGTIGKAVGTMNSHLLNPFRENFKHRSEVFFPRAWCDSDSDDESAVPNSLFSNMIEHGGWLKPAIRHGFGVWDFIHGVPKSIKKQGWGDPKSSALNSLNALYRLLLEIFGPGFHSDDALINFLQNTNLVADRGYNLIQFKRPEAPLVVNAQKKQRTKRSRKI